MSLDAKARDRLQTQGFACQRLGFESVKPWLRATPALSTAIILLGTVTGSAVVLWLFAVIYGFASTRRIHPFDRVSNLLRNREENDPLPRSIRPLGALLWRWLHSGRPGPERCSPPVS